jgi:hypothetical protein
VPLHSAAVVAAPSAQLVRARTVPAPLAGSATSLVVNAVSPMRRSAHLHQTRIKLLFRSLPPAAGRLTFRKKLNSKSPPVKDEGSAYFNMGALFALGGILLAVAGILLAFGLEFSVLGVLALLGGLAAGLLALFAGVFSITAQNKIRSRFNVVTVGGLLLVVGALALGWQLGGLVGVGTGMLLAGLGALLTGFSLTLGSETDTPLGPPK